MTLPSPLRLEQPDEPLIEATTMSNTQCNRLQLLDFPNEIISHIFHCLDSPSPFQQVSIQQPRDPAVRSLLAPLKQASLLCRRLRKLALPHLFQHIIINPSHLKTLLSFLTSNSLDVHVEAVVAYLPSPCSHYHPPWWFQILSQCPKLTSLSIIAPPYIFSEVTETNSRSRDIWAFNMPNQTLQLQWETSSHELPQASSSQTGLEGDHLLHARPWTSVLINEGSSLKAYTTYEYWLRSTPSPIYALNDPSRFTTFISNLRSFSFVAIFPTYSHVEHALHLVKQMHHLQSLFLKLIPEPDSTVLNDEIEEAKGHLDINDPWNEFDTSLVITAAACLYLSERKENECNEWGLPRLGHLTELRIDDVKMEGMRFTIEDLVTARLHEHEDIYWRYMERGVWRVTSRVV